MYSKYAAALKAIFSVLCIFTSHYSIGQSISINLPEYNSFCVGTTIEVPVNLQGIWSGSSFIAKFEGSNESDTTFYVTAENTTSPLRFKLPVIYASRTPTRTRTYYSCRLTISSTLPEVQSYSRNYVLLKMLPSIKLGNPIQGNPYSNYPTGPIHEYLNPGEYKVFTVDELGFSDYGDGFKLNDSSTYAYNSNGFHNIRTNVEKTYSIAKVWNTCGAGKIIPHEFTIKMNPFESIITDVFPKIMCDARDLNLTFDYKGTYNNDNVFTIEIANQMGDTVRQVSTTFVGDRKVRCVLDNTFRPGYYYVRVKSSSPVGVTQYKEFRIFRMKAVFNWIGLGEEPTSTVDYKQKVNIWLGLEYTTNSDDPKLLGLRLSDGKLIKSPEYRNIYSSIYSVDIYPDQNRYYTVDSLITTCGIVKSFDVVNPKYINISTSNSFAISGLKKAYCVDERVKIKLNTLVGFNNGNQFTVKMYQYNALIGSFPASFQNDSLSFILSFNNNAEPSLDQVQIKIESSSPVMHSTSTDGFFYIRKKPTIRLNQSTYNFQNPGHFYLSGYVYSHSPASLVINNGLKDTTVTLQNSYEYIYYIDMARFFVKNNTTFSVTSATNSCGTNQFSAPDNQASINITNPQTPKLTFITPQKPICINTSTPVYFDYAGNFNNDNTFIIYTYNNNYEKIEVGRGKTSPIMVTIPGNVYLYSPRLLLESTSPVVGGYYDVSDLPIAVHKPNETAFRFGNSNINDIYVIATQEAKKADGSIELIKGEKLIQDLEAVVYGYQATRFRVNNQWFTQAIEFIPARDTTLFLQNIENACGVFEVRDTVKVKVKKYRIRYDLMDASTGRCVDDMIDVSISIEGETENRPADFKFEFIPQVKPDSKFVAEIISRTRGYRLKIPDMPYEGLAVLNITPTTRQSDFAKGYGLASLILEKRHIAKLTAMDGSDTLWANPYDPSTSAVTFPVKIETLNSFNPSWYGTINKPDDPSFSVQSKISIKNLRYDSSPRYGYDLGDIEITSGRGTCGFTRYSGKVFLRKCIGDVTLNRDERYNDYAIEKFFSSGTIQSHVFYSYMGYPFYTLSIYADRNVLFSAKKSITLMPGFTANSGSVFKAEIKGCVPTPTN